MGIDGTIPTRVTYLPVRTLRVEVLEGPNAGLAATARDESLAVGTAAGNDLVLTDPTVSRYHLGLERRADGVLVVDHGSTNGTAVGPVRIHSATIAPGTVLRLGRTAIRVGDAPHAQVAMHAGDALGGLRGRSAVMRRLMADIERAARSDVSVLVVGESGTGKELIARALHEGSARGGYGGGAPALGHSPQTPAPRAPKPFVTVDCGALSPTLVASELFGHEKGAFTGADQQHAGAFERAHGGTLFLDEIGELPLAQQAALLGVLERRRFRRVGGTQDITVDVRVVSATHRDLRAQVNADGFRLDLYYRLAVVTLRVPPLRERPEDLPVLVEHFLREAGYDGPVEAVFPPASLAALERHRWPGNVRELRNLVEATVAMGSAPLGEIPGGAYAHGVNGSVAAAGAGVGAGATAGALLELPYKDARASVLHEFERSYLARLLERAEGNVARAAREAGMDRSHLFDLLRRHQLR